MTDPSDHDPVVVAALRAVDVPDHRAGFWEGLGRRLDGDVGEAPVHDHHGHGHDHDGDHDHGGDFGAHGHGHEHDLVEPLRPQPRLARLVAVAAVIAAVTLTASVVSRRDTSEGLRTAAPPDAPTATTPTTGASTTPPGAGDAASPDQAVVAWLEAIGKGAVADAAALTGPASKAYVESLGGTLEGFLVEAGEGYGAWASSPDRSTTEVDVGTDGGVTRAVVVVSGTWTGEGTDGFRVDAVPVVRTAGGPWLVEPWAFDADAGGRLELVSPAPGEDGPGGLPPDGVLEVTAPGRGEFAFSLDDGDVTRVAGRSGPGNTSSARFDPPGELSSRTHLAVVAYVDGDDTFTALAFTFLVEG